MESQLSKRTKNLISFISFILLVIGGCGSPLLSRLYFTKGGTRIWLSTWLQSSGFPILLLPLGISYFNRRKIEGPNVGLILMKLPAFIFSACIGFGFGLAGFFFAQGIQSLPVSTFTILSSTILVFIAISAFFIVKQKFNSYTINAIVLLMIGAVLLGLCSNSDKPEGETKKKYILGFIFTLIGSAVNGLGFPLIQLLYMKTKEGVTYTFMMEVQFVITLFGTAAATVAMLINKDFQAIPGEASEFLLGETKYCLLLVFTALVYQLYNLGLFGLLFTASALVSSIANSGLLPITEILAVIIYHEKFQAEKGISLALSIWGMASHFYGAYKNEKKNKVKETEIAKMPPPSTEDKETEISKMSPSAGNTTMVASCEV